METETHRKFKMNFAAKEKLETVSGAAPPPFRIFAGLRLAEVASATQAGGFPRRRRRQNAFGLF